MRINCIERVIVATPALEPARERWRRAGFAVAPGETRVAGLSFTRLAAGAVEIDLCCPGSDASGPLADAVSEAISRGGGMVGWVWGIEPASRESAGGPALPPLEAMADTIAMSTGLPGVFTAALNVGSDQDARRKLHREFLGPNPNTVDFLEHIVVMTPVLEDAIAAHEAIEVPCKRIREVGNGMRQAFFKLEQTVIEVVGPSRERPGCWGLAFMCSDICAAVATARANGLQATEPKKAIQGGQIARIVDPLDGVAVAFMQAP